MIRKILAVVALLVSVIFSLNATAGPASAASCFGSHQPGTMPWKWNTEIRATGLVVCSATVTMNATVTLTKNGTVVASHTDHVTADSWAPYTFFKPDPSGSQYYCERSSATWSGGSTTGSWQCNYY